MYVSYEQFQSIGMAELSEEEYAKLAPMADLIIDDWTLDRVARAVSDSEELPQPIVVLYCAIIEALPDIIEQTKPGKGGLITSFSNGIDSYSFDVTHSVSDQIWQSLGWMTAMLPIEWSSTVVSFEGGNRYAR